MKQLYKDEEEFKQLLVKFTAEVIQKSVKQIEEPRKLQCKDCKHKATVKIFSIPTDYSGGHWHYYCNEHYVIPAMMMCLNAYFIIAYLLVVGQSALAFNEAWEKIKVK